MIKGLVPALKEYSLMGKTDKETVIVPCGKCYDRGMQDSLEVKRRASQPRLREHFLEEVIPELTLK